MYHFCFNFILFGHIDCTNFGFNWCSVFTESYFELWKRFDWSKSLILRLLPPGKKVPPSKTSKFPCTPYHYWKMFLPHAHKVLCDIILGEIMISKISISELRLLKWMKSYYIYVYILYIYIYIYYIILYYNIIYYIYIYIIFRWMKKDHTDCFG